MVSGTYCGIELLLSQRSDAFQMPLQIPPEAQESVQLHDIAEKEGLF